MGIYGYAKTESGFAHGIVGETDSLIDGAGVIGVTKGNGQGVRAGSHTTAGISLVAYNNAGGLTGQFQGDVDITPNPYVNNGQIPVVFRVFGNAYKPGGGPWSVLSDARLKKSIQPLNGALRQLLQLRGVAYEYTNPSAFGEAPGTHIGMVAQEVEQVFPSWVDTGKDGYKRLTFRGFEAVTVEAVRELDAKVSANSKEAMARITDLERQNAELRHALEVLSETVKALQHK
jgi:Chaperone of endosialidase